MSDIKTTIAQGLGRISISLHYAQQEMEIATKEIIELQNQMVDTPSEEVEDE